MKLLAINSSPKENGQTARLLNLFIERAEKLAAEVKRINLYREKIEPFDGKLKQPIKKLTNLQKQLIACDGFVIATPTYWFNAPGTLKNLIDQLTPLEENGWQLEGKLAGFIVFAPEGGEAPVLQNLAMTFNHMGVLLAPYSLIFYRGKQDKWALGDCRDLADRMIQTINSLKKNPIDWL